MKSEHVIGQKAIRERNVRMAGKFAPLGKTIRGIVQTPYMFCHANYSNCPHQRTNMPIQFSRQENRRVILGFTGGLLFCLH